LILVLALIAILTTLAAPALSGFARRAELDNAAASLLALTRQANTRAIHEAELYRVVFDVKQQAAWLETTGDEGFEVAIHPGADPVTWADSIAVASDLETYDFDRFAIAVQPNGLMISGSVVLEQGGRYVALTSEASTEPYRLLTSRDFESLDIEGGLHAFR